MSINADVQSGKPLLPVLKTASVEALILDYVLLDDLFKGATRARLVDRCERDLRGARLKLLIGDPFPMLRTVLRRLNVLRNRVMHGCVTYGAVSKGLPSVVKGARVARSVVPALCELMVLHGPIVKWDPIPYPRVGFGMRNEGTTQTSPSALHRLPFVLCRSWRKGLVAFGRMTRNFSSFRSFV
jgi:hypothetical protein